MKGQIQFTQTYGDGSKSTYKYVEGDLEIKEKEGQLYYYDYVSSQHITLKFAITKLSMDCNFLQISGSNKDGYGSVAFLMSTNGFWDYKIEANRLRKVYAESPNYFRRNHEVAIDGEPDFDAIATKILKEKKSEK